MHRAEASGGRTRDDFRTKPYTPAERFCSSSAQSLGGKTAHGVRRGMRFVIKTAHGLRRGIQFTGHRVLEEVGFHHRGNKV
jgi:hypothetical protein